MSDIPLHRKLAALRHAQEAVIEAARACVFDIEASEHTTFDRLHTAVRQLERIEKELGR